MQNACKCMHTRRAAQASAINASFASQILVPARAIRVYERSRNVQRAVNRHRRQQGAESTARGEASAGECCKPASRQAFPFACVHQALRHDTAWTGITRLAQLLRSLVRCCCASLADNARVCGPLKKWLFREEAPGSSEKSRLLSERWQTASFHHNLRASDSSAFVDRTEENFAHGWPDFLQTRFAV